MIKLRYPSAIAKLARANRHIAELRDLIEGYDGAFIVPNRIPPLHTAWTIVLTHPVPELEIRSALGDAVHNLRATLDVLAVAIVREAKGNPNGVYFPFCEKVEDLDLMIHRRRFDRAPAQAIALLKEMKPYKGGNEALRGLHDLDIHDKHDDLIPTFSTGIQEDAIVTATSMYTRCGFQLKDGWSPVVGFSHPDEQPTHLYLSASFGENLPFARKQVVPTLGSLSELVADTIEAFSRL